MYKVHWGYGQCGRSRPLDPKPCTYVYIYIHTYMCYIYIHIEREKELGRERERASESDPKLKLTYFRTCHAHCRAGWRSETHPSDMVCKNMRLRCIEVGPHDWLRKFLINNRFSLGSSAEVIIILWKKLSANKVRCNVRLPLLGIFLHGFGSCGPKPV